MHKSLAIHDAYKRGDLEALQRLLDNPSNFPNCQGPRGVGEIILEYAIYHSPFSFIRKLLELGADSNYGDHAGFPSLIATLSSDRPDRYEILELLLSFGADIQQHGHNDYTPCTTPPIGRTSSPWNYCLLMVLISTLAHVSAIALHLSRKWKSWVMKNQRHF